jgi:uncharacterized protein
MRGMDRRTGKVLEGLAHLHQSLSDILGTPVGSRVMRRDYGSDLPSLLGAPMTPALLVEVTAAAAIAIRRWEPRFRLTRVILAPAAPGHLVVDLIGVYRPDGQEVTIDGVVVA